MSFIVTVMSWKASAWHVCSRSLSPALIVNRHDLIVQTRVLIVPTCKTLHKRIEPQLSTVDGKACGDNIGIAGLVPVYGKLYRLAQPAAAIHQARLTLAD